MTGSNQASWPRCGQTSGAGAASASAERYAANGEECTIVGTNGADVFRGTTGDDVICGLGGADTITGGGGGDTLLGGGDGDTLKGQSGNDDLDGQAGRDALNGGAGTNWCTVGSEDIQSRCVYDRTAPVLRDLSAAPIVVDVSSANKRFKLRVRVTDGTGLSQVSFDTEAGIVVGLGSFPET